MTTLTTADLYRTHDKKAELKKQTYDTIYNRCINTIKLSAKAGELCCIYYIPNFVFGCADPIINRESCANYIMNLLAEQFEQIRTIFIEPNAIFIDWQR